MLIVHIIPLQLQLLKTWRLNIVRFIIYSEIVPATAGWELQLLRRVEVGVFFCVRAYHRHDVLLTEDRREQKPSKIEKLKNCSQSQTTHANSQQGPCVCMKYPKFSWVLNETEIEHEVIVGISHGSWNHLSAHRKQSLDMCFSWKQYPHFSRCTKSRLGNDCNYHIPFTEQLQRSFKCNYIFNVTHIRTLGHLSSASVLKKMNSLAYEHGVLQQSTTTNSNSMTKVKIPSLGDIYYEFTERDKYRSVHPPQNSTHQYHDHRDSPAAGKNDLRRDHVVSSGSLHRELEKLSTACNGNRDDYQTELGRNTSNNVNSGSFFEIACAADCYDVQNQWPLSTHTTRNQSSAQFADFPLPDAPKCLSASHFNVDGRNWLSTKDAINQLLTKSQWMTWDYRDLEHLWTCNYLNTPRLAESFFQIRAYLNPDTGCVVIEMQKLHGDDTSFYQLYHSLLNEICSHPLPPSFSTSDPSNQNTSSSCLDARVDINIEFLLVPVLEMIQSDYPDMQEEALRLTCELSANVKSERSYCPQMEMNSFAGESARVQMLQLGYLTILVDLVCKSFVEDANGVITDLGPILAGHRALAAIYNLLLNREEITKMSDSMQKSQLFFGLLDRISKVGVLGHFRSSQIQQLCLEMTKLSWKSDTVFLCGRDLMPSVHGVNLFKLSVNVKPSAIYLLLMLTRDPSFLFPLHLLVHSHTYMQGASM